MSRLKIPKKVFQQGGIPAAFIAESIAKHQSKTDIGAHNIFLGQVRADVIEGKTVRAIDYTAYEEMATEKMHEIREATFDKFDITCMHIHHSLGPWQRGRFASLFLSPRRIGSCVTKPRATLWRPLKKKCLSLAKKFLPTTATSGKRTASCLILKLPHLQ